MDAPPADIQVSLSTKYMLKNFFKNAFFNKNFVERVL